MFVYGYHGCLCVIPVKLTPLLKFSINLQAVETVIVKKKNQNKSPGFLFLSVIFTYGWHDSAKRKQKCSEYSVFKRTINHRITSGIIPPSCVDKELNRDQHVNKKLNYYTNKRYAHV